MSKNSGGSQQYHQQDQQQNPHYFSSAPYPDFDELVTQVRNDDSNLMNRVLEPDGYFQTRATTLNEITRVVTELNKKSLAKRSTDDLPTIIMAWGKCRVGSTALTNLFGIAGIPAYYNPIKTAIRHFVLDGPAESWEFPQRSEKEFLFAKEMSGPYHLADCTVNPLQILVEAGYPISRIELLMLDRDPYQSLDSWLNKWGRLILPERLAQHYVLSALNGNRISTYAKKVGVRVSHYIYEASRLPKAAISKMFGRLGIEHRFHNGVVENWDEKGMLDSENSKIIFPPLPKPCIIPGLHASEKSYMYKRRNTDRVSDEYKIMIEKSGVLDRYRETALAFAEELKMNTEDCEKIFEGTPATSQRAKLLSTTASA